MKALLSHIGRTLIVAAVLLLVWGVASDTLLACPGCKEEIAQQSTDGLGKGLSYSVMGMVSMPFLLFGTVAGIVIRAYRKRAGTLDSDTPQS
jgi:hypothetical protein